MDVTGEGGHDDLLVRLGEDVVEHGADLVLVTDHPGHLGIRGVHAEQVHALVAESREGPQVGDAPVDRQGVDLEVTGDQHIAGTGADHGRHGVGDGVVDGDELESEGPVGGRLALRDHTQHGADAVLLEFGVDEGEGEFAAHQWDVVAQAQQVGNAADVILVTVGEHQGDDVVESVLDVVEVGQDEIDARLVLLGEEDTAVDDEQFAVNLEDGHVAADLAEAPQGHDAHRAIGNRTGGLERWEVRHATQSR